MDFVILQQKVGNLSNTLGSVSLNSSFLIVKFLVRVDDALDLFAEHAIGGIIGLLLNAFFASGDIIALDDVNIGFKGGWVDHNWKQLYIQIAYICATCAYTFVVTALIAKFVDLVPGLHLRNTPEAEKLGMDEIEVRSHLFHLKFEPS